MRLRIAVAATCVAGALLLALFPLPATAAQSAKHDSSASVARGPSIAGCREAKADNASVPGRDAASTANKVVVVAQHNLWFHRLRNDSAFVAWDGSGRRTSPYEPWIGFYDMSKRADIERQIALAADNGVDAFSSEWISPLGSPGSLEADLDNAFLKARNLCRIRWAIF